MKMHHRRSGVRRSFGFVSAMSLAAWLVSGGLTAASATCSESQLGDLKVAVNHARDRWRSTYSAADHAAVVAARDAAVAYATECQDALGGNLTELLRGAVPIPYVDRIPNGEGTHAPGDEVDLLISHVPSQISGLAGNTLIYFLTVANQGATATTPCLSDALIADEIGFAINLNATAFDDPAQDDSCNNNGSGGVSNADDGFTCCLNVNLPSQFPYLYWSIRVQVDASDAATISSEASVAAAEFELNNGNNTSSASIRFTAQAGVSIVSSATPTADPNTGVTYNSVITNNGPSVAENIVAKNFVPSQVTITSFSSTQGACSNSPGTNTVSCNIGTLAPGVSRNMTVNGLVKLTTPGGTILFDDTQVTTSTDDPNGADNVDTATTTVNSGFQHGLSLAQTGPISATAGDQITYTTIISNTDLETANEVVVREFAPAELDIVSMTTTLGACNPNGTTGPSCILGSMTGLSQATVTVTGKVRTNTAGGTIIYNSMQVTSDAFETNNGDNIDTDGTAINAAVSGLNVGITGPGTAVAGTQVDFDLSVINVGSDPATNVQLKDVIPSDIDVTNLVISQGNCSATGGGVTGTTVTCTVGTLPPSAQVTATIQGILKPGTADGSVLINSVAATGTIFESDTADNTASVSVTVDAQADLSVDTVDSTDPVNIDTPFRWVNTITNAGPSDATGVVLIDTIPHLVEELKVRVLPSGCDRFEETIKCSLGTIKAGASVTMNVELEAMVNAGPAISHTVEVSSLADDPDLTFNSDTETTTLQAPDMVGSFTSLSSACDAALKVCQIKGKYKVTNAGNAKSVQSSLRFVSSANTTLGSGDPQIKKFTINQLKPGESQELKYNLVFPINQYVIAQVDSANQIAETNEANNLSLKGPFPKP